MSVDYEQLRLFVKEAMFTGGGINEPSAPEGVPHRMPAADTADKEQEMGDPKANKMYEVALAAREATEELVEALDDPIFDGAYEYAFKASSCLRRVLNSLEESGAHPMPSQVVVAPPNDQQKFGTGGGNPYSGAMDGGGPWIEEANDKLKGFGTGVVTRQAHAQAEKGKGASVASGDILSGVDDRERQILLQIEEVLTDVAEEADLVKYRPRLKTFLEQFLKTVKRDINMGAGSQK